MPNTTLSLHSHSVYSQRDSIIKLDAAAAKIKAAGCTHYAISDHGTIQGWLALRDACEKNKLTPVYGCELYVNDDLPLLHKVLEAREHCPAKEKSQVVIRTIQEHAGYMSPAKLAYFTGDLEDPTDIAKVAKKLFNRLAFGYTHLVATAISARGRENLIRLVNLGWDKGYYYKPQVTTDECLAHAEGLVWTTACMGGPIARRLQWDPTGTEAVQYLRRWDAHKAVFHLEVQPLDLLAQIKYNQKLIQLHQLTGFPLILSQDNHHLEENEWIAHRIMMLAQNDEVIDRIEDIYEYKGEKLPFSDLQARLGVPTNWQTQLVIEQEKLPLVLKAGHHYANVRLHWRTDDDVRKQIELTNPELLPVIDQCLARTSEFSKTIPEIKWSQEFRIPKFEDARTKVLTICANRLSELGIIHEQEAKDYIVVEGEEKTNEDQMVKYVEWLGKEDKVINACGFYNYIWTLYLLTKKVQDEGIPIGYARGSGGGCLIMYLLGIIRVDPVRYGLFFDRFLNPARLGLNPKTLAKEKEISSCPDVDLDFSSIHRKRVIEIAAEIFGKEYVVPVGTIGEVKVKTGLAEICRVCQIPATEYMPASKELPNDVTGTMTWDEAMEVPNFKAFIKKHPILDKYTKSLVGTIKSTGTHAGGVCIADVPIAQSIPVVRAGAKEGGDFVTGFPESAAERGLESVGFIKFDCLATDTVDHLSLCAVARYEAHLAAGGAPWVKGGERLLYPEQMPDFKTDDPYVMKTILHEGNTDGIFQLEESIGKDQCRLIKPDTIDELADIGTMIRPGCLQALASYTNPVVDKDGNVSWTTSEVSTTGLHFEYAARKFYPKMNPPPDFPEAILEVLRATHYCCIYQEQIMLLIERITGGYMSLGEGDLYRRLLEQLGKRKEGAKEKIEKLEAEMKSHSPFPSTLVDQVCTVIKGGANYSFNKSHSLSYSLFSYGQAWFKAYYPHIFYASHVTLLAAKNNLDKVHKIVNNARAMGIEIRSPHVLHSGRRATWSPDGKIIYLPFTVMKGLKSETAEAIREIVKVHTITTIDQFILRAIQHPAIKRNHLIALAQIGALDDMGVPRIKAVAMCSYVAERATTKSPEAAIVALCDEAKMFVPLADIPTATLVENEMRIFGGFINECPLDKLKDRMEAEGWIPMSTVEPMPDKEFQVYFMVTSITKKVHKSGKSQGKEWYKLTGWDGHGVCELSIWNHDLDGKHFQQGDTTVIGYRNILGCNRVYRAVISNDGQRPATLAYRGSRYVGNGLTNTLFLEKV